MGCGKFKHLAGDVARIFENIGSLPERFGLPEKLNNLIRWVLRLKTGGDSLPGFMFKRARHSVPWGLLARFVVTVALILFVLHQLEDARMERMLKRADWGWLLGAVGIYGVVVGLAILRWHVLLTACGAGWTLLRTVQLTLIGLFANSFMPGAMGGDLVKAIYGMRESPQIKATVVVSIVMERLLGFLAMFLVSTLLILSRLKVLTQHPLTAAAVWFYFAVMFFLVGMMVLGSLPRVGQWLPFWKRLPFQETLREVSRAYHFFLRHPGCLWGGVGLSVMAHLALMLTFYFVALSLQIGLGFLDFAAVLPLVALVTILPITINGIGLRELAFGSFFAVYGEPGTQWAAVVVSLGGFFVTLLWSVLGGVVFFVINAPRLDGPILISRNGARVNLKPLRETVNCLFPEKRTRINRNLQLPPTSSQDAGRGGMGQAGKA